MRASVLLLLLSVAAGGADARGAALTTFRQGEWLAGAYSNDQTKQFDHCAATAPYKSGIFLTAIINRQGNWGLGFSDPTWNLMQGQRAHVAISFDGGPTWNNMALVVSAKAVLVPLAQNSALMQAFRQGEVMNVTSGSASFVFNLNGTASIMSALTKCVSTELAIERGERPPETAKRSPPMPIPAATAQPNDANAEMELAATRIATNLLLQAKLPNAHLLDPSQTPDAIKRLGVAWKSDEGIGAVELLPQGAGKDAQQIASQLIESDAAVCKGDFASGRSSSLVDDTVVTKAFTGCKDSTGTSAVRYFVVHNEGSGYVVFALTAAATGTQGPPTEGNLSDANFQTAAVKAAFTK